jgi:formylglycine-generating enzyme required for sulfatase activity
LAYRIIDTGADGGILVSPLGLQEGAERVAAAENIISVRLNEDCNRYEFVLGFLNQIRLGVLDQGVLDMGGNVWEWTRSLWRRNWEEPDYRYPYRPTHGRETLAAGRGVLRVLRGGACNYRLRYLRCAYRYGGSPDDSRWVLGFRVVVRAAS